MVRRLGCCNLARTPNILDKVVAIRFYTCAIGGVFVIAADVVKLSANGKPRISVLRDIACAVIF